MTKAFWRTDSSAGAVEAALVSMLLLTIIFGIVETSFLFKDWLTVSTAARAGARMGSSEPCALNNVAPGTYKIQVKTNNVGNDCRARLSIYATPRPARP